MIHYDGLMLVEDRELAIAAEIGDTLKRRFSQVALDIIAVARRRKLDPPLIAIAILSEAMLLAAKVHVGDEESFLDIARRSKQIALEERS
jgi:hypothetical protein